MSNIGSFLTILPGGSTSKIQVLDVGVNKPFKDGFRRKWTDWMAHINLDGTMDITRLLLATWVKEVWEDISEESIKRTWTKVHYS